MPVRKIPKNYLGVTGGFASAKNSQMLGFESLLEKEYMLLLEFDENVESFEEQPVNIPVPGVIRGYTPDVLVRYRADPVSGEIRKPLLTDIKHTSDLQKNADKYRNKFAAAEQYSFDLGWEFRVTTESEIRIPRLANIKFLRAYRNVVLAERDCAELLRRTNVSGGFTSSKILLDDIATSDEERLHWLPVIWNLILTRRLIADLDKPFGDDVSLHLPIGSP
jgi:hypothetical protein